MPPSPTSSSQAPEPNRRSRRFIIVIGLTVAALVILLGLLSLTRSRGLNFPATQFSLSATPALVIIISTSTDTPTSTPSATRATPVLIVRLQNLPVRSGPDIHYPSIRTLRSETILNVKGISPDGAWYQIELDDGNLGWVSADSSLISGHAESIPVILQPTATPTDTATETPTFTPTASLTSTPTRIPNSTRTPTPPVASSGTSLRDGDTVIGMIDNDQPAVFYTVEAEEGDNLTIVMAAISGNLDPFLVLLDSNNNILASDDDSGGSSGAALLDFEIPDDGIYTLVATRYQLQDGTSSGEYELTIAEMRSASNAGSSNTTSSANDTLSDGDYLRYGDSGTATINNSQPYLQFTFDGQAGEAVTITMETTSGDLEPLLGLFDANGELLMTAGEGGSTARLTATITESGEYIIVTTRLGVEDGDTSGEFILSLVNLGASQVTAEATEEPAETPAASRTPTVTNTPRLTDTPSIDFTATARAENNLTATAQVVVVRDRSGLKVGEGVVRLFAPDTLTLGEVGEIRVEIEVFRPNAQFAAITNLASLPTATPDIRLRPTNTPPPLTENYAITIFEYMGVDVAGISLSNFTLDPIPPTGMQHFTEPDQMRTWQWDIRADDRKALGENRLRMEVYLSDVAGNRYELAIDPIPFTIEVVEASQEAAAAAGAAANAPESGAVSIVVGSSTPTVASGEGRNNTVLPTASLPPVTQPTGPEAGSQAQSALPTLTGEPQRSTTVQTEAPPSAGDTSVIVIALATIIAAGIGAVVVVRLRRKPSAFISYRRIPSATLATLIAKELEKHGIKVFVDTRSVDGGGLFPRRLIEAIHDNDVFVCLVADTTFESDWVREEIAHAHEISKTMIPVFQESWEQLHPKPKAPTEHIKALLDSDGVHMLDIRNVYVDEAIEELAKMIRVTARKTKPG
ncbi:MAG: TIR domain-containing protein [Anaerolineaceae bacterium]|nr:TIR domain-containing protein [Anaerolineaceae bacterium]